MSVISGFLGLRQLGDYTGQAAPRLVRGEAQRLEAEVIYFTCLSLWKLLLRSLVLICLLCRSLISSFNQRLYTAKHTAACCTHSHYTYRPGRARKARYAQLFVSAASESQTRGSNGLSLLSSLRTDRKFTIKLTFTVTLPVNPL